MNPISDTILRLLIRILMAATLLIRDPASQIPISVKLEGIIDVIIVKIYICIDVNKNTLKQCQSQNFN